MAEEKDITLILDDDEEIKKSYKPRKKTFFLFIVFTNIILFVFMAFTITIGVLILTGVFSPKDPDTGEIDRAAAWIPLFMGGILTIVFVSNIVRGFVSYKKTFFAVTNKRIIIRSGFIGADFRSLELSSIASVDVRVDFLDKLAKPNTGTVYFGSNASPINGNNQVRPYAFVHINNPYEAYKEIKQIIGESKNGKGI